MSCYIKDDCDCCYVEIGHTDYSVILLDDDLIIVCDDCKPKKGVKNEN
tara:strand:+ start:1836 stop:1979 length:144 start_codon:yes stop_codon:yes gene_type:complete